MIVGAIVCFVLAVVSISTGHFLMPGGIGATVVLIGVGVLLIYLNTTEEKRAQKKREKKRLERVEQVKSRFANIPFVSLVMRDISIKRPDFVSVLPKEVKFGDMTYAYADYGLSDLGEKGCEDLAIYIGACYFGEYETIKKTRFVGGRTGSYSGYVSSTGTVSISPDFSGGEVFAGYTVRKPVPPTPVQPKQKW